MLVLVAIQLPATDTALVASVEAWLRAEVARRDLPLRRVTAPEVRLALVPPGERPSGRNLAEALAARFEAVRPLAPSREPIPGADRVASLALNGRRTRTSRELYWRPMFVALGAAVLALEGGLPDQPAYDPRQQPEEPAALGP